MPKLKERVDHLKQFLGIDIWRIKLDRLPKGKAFLYKQLRIIILAFRGFQRDEVALKSSALTYLSLLSIVPVVALAFGISQVFGFDIKEQIGELLRGQEAALGFIYDWANELLEVTKGGVLAGFGFLVLLYTVMRLLNEIEGAFNDIWEVKKHRSFQRKASEYTAILLIAPVLVVFSSSLNVYVSTQLRGLTEQMEYLDLLAPFILFLLQFLPYTLIWLLLFLLYLTMPNTRVRVRSALLAGILTGTVFNLVQVAYVEFQVGVSRYNAIYGSFAALPLFLIWMQISWMIVLFGAELSFAYQNASRYEFTNERLQPSIRHKRLMALMVTKLIIDKFKEGKPAPSISEIADAMAAPIRYVSAVVRELHQVGVISEVVRSDTEDNGYQPGMAIDLITISLVTERLESRGLENICLNTADSSLSGIKESIDKMEDQLRGSEYNQPLARL